MEAAFQSLGISHGTQPHSLAPLTEHDKSVRVQSECLQASEAISPHMDSGEETSHSSLQTSDLVLRAFLRAQLQIEAMPDGQDEIELREKLEPFDIDGVQTVQIIDDFQEGRAMQDWENSFGEREEVGNDLMG